MADKKISDLALLNAVDLDPASDYLPIVDPSEAAAADQNKRILAEDLLSKALTEASSTSASLGDSTLTGVRIAAILKERGITNIKAIAFKSAEGREVTGNQSYKTETRPTGRFLGDYANVAAAWAANKDGVASVNGDYYWDTTDDAQYELSGGTSRTINYRAGSAHMPIEAVFVHSGSSTSERLRVFDLTDPLMPMWIEYTAASNNMLSGASSAPNVAVTGAGWDDGRYSFGRPDGVGRGVIVLDFVNDAMALRTVTANGVYAGTLSANSANSAKGFKFLPTAGFLLSGASVNSIAAHNGYIAAPTSAGFSVIKPDNSVIKDSGGTDPWKTASILNGRIYTIRDNTNPEQLHFTAPIDELSAGFSFAGNFTTATVPALSAATLTGLGKADNSLLITSASAVDQLWPNPADKESSLIARMGTTYSTPPMKKPEVMLICSTAEGAVSDAEIADQDFNSWTDASTGTATAVVNAGAVDMSGTDSSNRAIRRVAITCIIGEAYEWSAECTAFTSGEIVVGIDTDTTYGSLLSSASITGTGTTATTKFIATATTLYALIATGSTGGIATIDNFTVKRAVRDQSGKSNHATIHGSLTATAEVTGGVAGLSGFSVANYLEAPNPWSSIGTGEAYLSGAFISDANAAFQNLAQIAHYSGGFLNAFATVRINSTGVAEVIVSNDGGLSSVTAASPSTYDDGLLHTWVVRKTATHYLLDIDDQQVASVAVGSHGNLTFNASAVLRIGKTASDTSFSPDTTIWFAGAGQTALTDEEVSLMHTHMRNLIEGKASLDEIPSALAYDPVRKAVEMVGATKRQTLQDGAITLSEAHGQGTTPAVAVGSRSEIGIGGTTSVEVSVPERNLREYEARLTTERFTVVYAGDASRTTFPDPTDSDEMAVTIGAKPVRVSNAGSVQTEGAADDYTVDDYGLGRYVAEFAVAPGGGNDVVIEFEREVYA